MAERVVRVRLSATIDDYKKGMLEAAQATRTVGTEAEKLAQTRQGMQLIGAAGVAMGAALAAGIGVAVSKFIEFDAAMSNVEAATHESAENMDLLRQAALDAGAATVFSATEAANAIEEMGKAGVSTKDILGGGLAGALDLAAAGGLGVADAAGIAATALKVFNLEGSDMSHVADLLAAGAGKAMGDVTDLSAALAQGGQVAAATGLSIEETTASLAAFASQGLLGSDAGTSFKTMLQRLTPQSAEAQKKMDELGVSAYDASGNFIGMAEFAGNLQDALRDLTPEQRNAALSVMFGSDAVRAANVIYSEGEEGIRDWISAVDDQGYAAETAATRLNNLKGDWEAFSGALDTAFISMGEGANGPLRVLVQGLTDLVDGFNSLPDWAKQAGLGMAALVSGIGLVGGAALLAIPQIADFKNGLITLGVSAARTERMMSMLSRAAGVAGVLGALVLATSAANELGQALAEAVGPSAEEVASKVALAKSGLELFQAALSKRDASTAMIDRAGESLTKVGAALDDARAKSENWFDGISGANQELLSTVFTMGEELDSLAKTDFSAASAQFLRFADDAGLSKSQIIQLMKEMPGFRDEVIKAAAAVGVASDDQSLLNFVMDKTPSVTKTASDSYMEQADAVQNLESQLMDLIDAIDVANGKNRDAVTSNIDYQNTLRDVDEQIANIANGVDGFARGLDISTQAGADNKAMLVGLSEDAWNAAAAQLQLDGDTGNFTATLEQQRQKLYDAAIAMGASEEEAATLRDTLLGMPNAKTIQVLAETSQAQSKLSGLWNSINDLVGKTWNIPVSTTVVGAGTVLKQANGGFYERGRYANSGFEPGIYPFTPGGIDKFAEAYDEAYISLDPARRSRSEAVWVKTGQEMGMFSGQGRSTPTAVYVQNPFTGEYLLAQVASVADVRIGTYDDGLASAVRRGRRTV